MNLLVRPQLRGPLQKDQVRFGLDWWLLSAILFFCALIIGRAWQQDITIDEADTAGFVLNPYNLWNPSSNNHLLNTALMRIVVAIIPWSPFVLRIPALCGGFLYLFFAGK